MELNASVVNMGSGKQQRITTRDVSSDGAYFLTATPLSVGTKVAVSLELLSAKAVPERQAGHSWVDVSGTVIRNEHNGMVVVFVSKYRIHGEDN